MATIRRRLGIVDIPLGMSEQTKKEWLKEFEKAQRLNETFEGQEYYIVEHADFALLSVHCYLPLYNTLFDPFVVTGIDEPPFKVLWYYEKGKEGLVLEWKDKNHGY